MGDKDRMGRGDGNELGMASVVQGLPTKRTTLLNDTLMLVTVT